MSLQFTNHSDTAHKNISLSPREKLEQGAALAGAKIAADNSNSNNNNDVSDSNNTNNQVESYSGEMLQESIEGLCPPYVRAVETIVSKFKLHVDQY